MGVKIKQEFKVKNEGSRSNALGGSGSSGLKMENSFAALDQCVEDGNGDVKMMSEDKNQGINSQQQVDSKTKGFQPHHNHSKSPALTKKPVTPYTTNHNSNSIAKPSSIPISSDLSSKPFSFCPNNHNNNSPQNITPSNKVLPPDPPVLNTFCPNIADSSLDVNSSLMDILMTNPVLQQCNLDLSQDQVNEVMGLVVNRIKLSKELESKWSFEQYKLYVDMCGRYNFSEGLNDEEFSEVQSDYEVDSDENEAAQDMKMDVEILSQNAQALSSSEVKCSS
ncbi:hypothetical protein HanIR_Chr02g0051131 [Helianthus annuus]|nr:hypothetical protein HanIR_Chr02g0051131 [Helianthus annuus]